MLNNRGIELTFDHKLVTEFIVQKGKPSKICNKWMTQRLLELLTEIWQKWCKAEKNCVLLVETQVREENLYLLASFRKKWEMIPCTTYY